MMRNERRQLLDRSLIDLSREMDVDEVLLYLQGKGVFTDAVVDKVLSAGSVSAQRAAIVRAVKSRGDRAFDAFFRALLHARQSHLAELLRPLVNEDVLQTM
ncbi:caspase recruitment domain protein [Ancylostoma ceylanicum]|uniref:Caspase recruitment domain protein n=1 Tax=Ancylostoma ceylanicum TaxID=53326 RepID=A0A0D6L493_9BILA|nr:caspase recruitment domain protein [Ancylostoma ceylanicum]